MSNPFEAFKGKNIHIEEPHFYGYVPTDSEHDDMAQQAAEDLHPDEELEEGWQIAAISGAMEEGEMVQMDGFLAIKGNKFYICDEGSINHQKTPLAELTIQLDDE